MADRTAGMPRLDEAVGRSDGAVELRRHLATAPPAYLSGALDNPALGPGEVLLMLRNRQAPATLVARVGDDPRWLRHYRIKHALAAHPRTPVTLSQNVVPHLFWNELAELSTATHVNPVTRRIAERRLVLRLETLELGERTNLARRAGRGIIPELAKSGEPRVLAALLQNPRCVEPDVVTICRGETAPRECLAEIAADRRWGCRREVLRALVGNARTPVATALGALRRLRAGDLRPLLRDATVPRIVRLAAERRLLEQDRLLDY